MKTQTLSALLIATLPCLAFAAEAPMKVSFDTPPSPFTEAAGFGVEPTRPTAYSWLVPEGNYHVKVTFGPTDGLTIKAENRRLMAEQLKADGEQQFTFVVNVRRPEIAGGKEVKLNDREKVALGWDQKLTLEFLSSTPCVKSVEIAPAADVPTVYIAGDSTVCDQNAEPWTGWGQMLPRFFDDGIAVSNHAESGRTLRSFRGDRRFDKILSQLKAGDYVFVQFGHNDMKEKGEGIGAMLSYKKDLEDYVARIKDKGATPVLVTSMYRRRFSGDQIQDSLGDYPAAVRLVASEQKLPLIDLHEMSGRLFSAMGPEGTKKAFVFYPANTFPGQKDELKDNTHFNAYGGYELARCVVEALRKSDLPLAAHIAKDVKPFDPSKPDDVAAVVIPASAAEVVVKPEGS